MEKRERWPRPFGPASRTIPAGGRAEGGAVKPGRMNDTDESFAIRLAVTMREATSEASARLAPVRSGCIILRQAGILHGRGCEAEGEMGARHQGV